MFRPNWQTYRVEKRARGLRRYRAGNTYIEINGALVDRPWFYTRRGAEKWIARLRERQNEWQAAS